MICYFLTIFDIFLHFGLIKRERARRASEQRGIHILRRGIPPIFSEMAGLIRSGIYTGNDQYVGENVKFIKVF